MFKLKASAGIAPLAIMAVIALVAAGGISIYLGQNNDSNNQTAQNEEDHRGTFNSIMSRVESSLDELENYEASADFDADVAADMMAKVDADLTAAGNSADMLRERGEKVDDLIERLQANFERRMAVADRVLAKVPGNARAAISANIETRTQNFNSMISRLRGESDFGGSVEGTTGGSVDTDDGDMKGEADVKGNMNGSSDNNGSNGSGSLKFDGNINIDGNGNPLNR